MAVHVFDFQACPLGYIHPRKLSYDHGHIVIYTAERWWWSLAPFWPVLTSSLPTTPVQDVQIRSRNIPNTQCGEKKYLNNMGKSCSVPGNSSRKIQLISIFVAFKATSISSNLFGNYLVNPKVIWGSWQGGKGGVKKQLNTFAPNFIC